MVFVIGLLTFVMVLVCLILILLVLIQLPKKEAGAALAFGGAATDALFGAGSGNVLTKTTKYAAGTFFVLAVVLSLLQSHLYHHRTTEFKRNLSQTGEPPIAPPPAAASPSAPPATNAVSTPVLTSGNSNIMLLPPTSAATNGAPAPQR
jgi:preprotein translocase subunit SecG